MENRREVAVDLIRGQYRDCQVIDVERALLLIPPVDGRYGMLPLEVPILLPSSPCCDEQTLRREVIMQMSGLTRALPDVGQQALDVLGFNKLAERITWEGTDLGVFLRFGIITKTDGAVKSYCSRRLMLKITPPQYATDVQVIIKVPSGESLKALGKLMRKVTGCKYYRYICSTAQTRGYGYVFGAARITREFVAIRDRIEHYWDLVNNPGPAWQEQRKFINLWMAGVDFR